MDTGALVGKYAIMHKVSFFTFSVFHLELSLVGHTSWEALSPESTLKGGLISTEVCIWPPRYLYPNPWNP